MILRAAFVGAVVGAALFLGASLSVGLEPCVPDTVWGPAFEVANGPARAISEVWTDGPLEPQSLESDCGGQRPHRFRATAFVFWGLVVYAGGGGIASGLWRMWTADR